jgi:CotH kinase protein/Lamin Tail Domain/Fn3 associated/FlgD Ig-like domain
MKNKEIAVIVLLLISPILLLAQSIFINEAMSSNQTAILDDDGDSSDWIELYNAENYEVNLEGFGLTDDVADPFMWEFPDVSIPAQDFLLVFASGKNRAVNYWETIIDWGADWKYFVGTEEPPSDWRTITFDDSSWDVGPSGFGYEDGDDATIIPATISCFVRHSFQITDLNNIIQILLHVDYDDAFVAYLNNVEIARKNIGDVGTLPAFDENADLDHEAQIYQGGLPSIFNLENWDDILVDGDNVLSIQVHNLDIISSDLSLIPFLTLGLNNEPVSPNGLATILEPSLPHSHTNFKISSSGETLLLSDAVGTELDEVDVIQLTSDISYGRQPDGSENWFLFDESTPENPNSTTGFLNFATYPEFDLVGGFYNTSFTFGFLDIPAGETIFYSLDGTIPTENSFEYSSPVTLDSTAAIRARSLSTGSLPSSIVTQTFFIDIIPTMPVISLVTDPYNLFDNDYGIYALGDNASSTYPYYGANFWEDWERPINLQMFEPDGSNAFQIDAGTKIFGNFSRGHPQKSLAIYTRDEYGFNSINYQIFPDQNIDEFNNIILRNSGNDWEWSMMRDGLMTSALENSGLDRQAYRPSKVYINGQYWGIHNIREKINEHFIANHHNVQTDQIDLLEDNAVVVQGDNVHYLNLLDFMESNDIGLMANYDYVCTQMDMENYLNYLVAELYYANRDWPGRNIKFWREQTETGKWKWIIYDLDFGLGYYADADFDMFDFALEPNGPDYPNPPWSTFLFRTLVTNDQFVHDLVNLMSDYLNSVFLPENFNSKLLANHDFLESEMQDHVLRWNHTMANWENEMLVMQWYVEDRPYYMREHIMAHFNLPGTVSLDLQVSPANSGAIQVNSLEITEFPWNGIYFETNSLEVSGLSTSGWEFVGWTGSVTSNSPSITLDMDQDYTLTAVFELVQIVDSPIVINEINYHSSSDFNVGDWIEIYNNSAEAQDLSGWILKDNDDIHSFELPQNFTLEPEEYFVFCNDTIAFNSLFPDVENYQGNFDFGLSGSGDMVRIFNDYGDLVDNVHYEVSSPWPTEPDGNGPTLSLRNPGMDNSLALSWAASNLHGTPGEINDVYVSTEDEMIALTSDIQLIQNFPNPFNPSTKISFSLPNESRINLSIFNIKGQLVKTLLAGYMDKGVHTVLWNGRNSSSKAVASGIYYYKLSNGTSNRVKKMLLLK